MSFNKAVKHLSLKQREFIDLHVVDGLPLYQAYVTAFRDSLENRNGGRVFATDACRYGKRILDSFWGQKYVEGIKKYLAKKSVRERFLTLDEKRAFLADVVRTPIGEVDENSELAEEKKISPNGHQTIKLPSKLKAIELDSRLTGEFNDALKVNVSEKILELAEEFI